VVLPALPPVLAGGVDSLLALLDDDVLETGVELVVRVVTGSAVDTSGLTAWSAAAWCTAWAGRFRVTCALCGVVRFAGVLSKVFGLLANSVGGMTTANPVSPFVPCAAFRGVRDGAELPGLPICTNVIASTAERNSASAGSGTGDDRACASIPAAAAFDAELARTDARGRTRRRLAWARVRDADVALPGFELDVALPDSKLGGIGAWSASWTAAEPSPQKSAAPRGPSGSSERMSASGPPAAGSAFGPNGTSSSRGPSQSRGSRTTLLSACAPFPCPSCGPSVSGDV
jgi:hypothetical protein